jgi:ubiquitin-conjugating enzyme E2 S
LTVIRCLLIEPNAESALNEEAGKLLLESFGDFAKKARLMTSIHAIKKLSVLTAAGGANALNAEAASGAGASGQATAAGSISGPVKAKSGRALDKKRSLKRL